VSGSYTNIVAHYEACFAKHGDSHFGVDWPNQCDAETRYSVMLEVVRENRAGLRLLDFGCGASHLYPHLLKSRFSQVEYHGLDISPSFCEVSRKKFPANKYYCLDVLAAPERLAPFDYIVMNGVFSEKRDLTFDEMFDYCKRLLRAVFPKVRIGLAFNLMSKFVDWEREDLFHMPIDTLCPFLVSELTRNFVIRNDYGLYEYTVYVYREPLRG